MFPKRKRVINVKVMYMCKWLVLIKRWNSIKRKCFFAPSLLDKNMWFHAFSKSWLHCYSGEPSKLNWWFSAWDYLITHYFWRYDKGLDHQLSDREEPILPWTLTEGSEYFLSFQALVPTTPLVLLEYGAVLFLCVQKPTVFIISYVKNNIFSIFTYI